MCKPDTIEHLYLDFDGFFASVEEFRTQLEEHVLEEETELCPKLREKLGEEGNIHVTAAMIKEGLIAA